MKTLLTLAIFPLFLLHGAYGDIMSTVGNEVTERTLPHTPPLRHNSGNVKPAVRNETIEGKVDDQPVRRFVALANCGTGFQNCCDGYSCAQYGPASTCVGYGSSATCSDHFYDYDNYYYYDDGGDCGPGYPDCCNGFYCSNYGYTCVGSGSGYCALPPTTARPVPRPVSRPTYRPSRRPSQAPVRPRSVRPTPTQSVKPTPTSKRPTIQPTESGTFTVPDAYELFAVVGGSRCAETLRYGPDAIALSGAGSSATPYFLSTSTPHRHVAHAEWLQVVVSGPGVELFRIYWTFRAPKSLSQHIGDAVAVGESVSYRVEHKTTPATYYYAGTWWFSSASKVTASLLDAVAEVACCFSEDRGAWGAAEGAIDASKLPVPGGFWGIGNFHGNDESCATVYTAVAAPERVDEGVRAYMYYNYGPAVPKVQVQVALEVNGEDYASYQQNVLRVDRVIKQTIADCISGVAVEDIYDFIVLSGPDDSSGKTSGADHTAHRSAAPDTNPGASVPASNLRSGARRMSASSSIVAQARVVPLASGRSLEAIREVLDAAVVSGQCSALLQEHALAEDVSELKEATCSSMLVTHAIPSAEGNSTKSLAASAIVGIVFGIVAFLGMVVAGVYYFSGSGSGDAAQRR